MLRDENRNLRQIGTQDQAIYKFWHGLAEHRQRTRDIDSLLARGRANSKLWYDEDKPYRKAMQDERMAVLEEELADALKLQERNNKKAAAALKEAEEKGRKTPYENWGDMASTLEKLLKEQFGDDDEEEEEEEEEDKTLEEDEAMVADLRAKWKAEMEEEEARDAEEAKAKAEAAKIEAARAKAEEAKAEAAEAEADKNESKTLEGSKSPAGSSVGDRSPVLQFEEPNWFPEENEEVQFPDIKAQKLRENVGFREKEKKGVQIPKAIKRTASKAFKFKRSISS